MAKQKAKERLLAVDPGTKELGIAVLEGKKLLFQSVVTLYRYPARERPKQARNRLREVICHYKPRILVIEKVFSSSNKNTKGLQLLAKTIKSLARRNGLRVAEYAPKTVRKCICGTGKATKREVAATISAKYPELHIYLSQDRRWKERHWQNLFDAIAVGLTYQGL